MSWAGRGRFAQALALALGLGAGCRTTPGPVRPDDGGGFPALHVRWTVATSDRSSEVTPQEFAGVASYDESVYGGSVGGRFFAMRAWDGHVRWSKRLGSVSSQPLVVARGTILFVGTDDGEMLSVDADTGAVNWRYLTRGPILRPPVLVEDTLIFSNEADQVYALDARTGEFRWQYKGDTPEEYTLRGHAGVTVVGDLVFTGFASGTMVALRVKTGSVAWLTTLKGDADRFIDVDATPVAVGDTVYVTSSSGGVWAIDQATGLVRWRTPLMGNTPSQSNGAVGGIASDGERLFVAAADLGIYALDLDGNILWRQGTRGGGEPATPQISGDLLIYALTGAGVYIVDKRSGALLEYFDPGDGVSADPVVVDNRDLYVMSNRGVLYAFDLRSPTDAPTTAKAWPEPDPHPDSSQQDGGR